MSRITVLGSGAWGTALALSLHRTGRHRLTLWSHGERVARLINDQHDNTIYLPGFLIPADIAATTELSAAVDQAEIIISVMPTAHVREVFTRTARLIAPEQLVVSASKGIEDGTHLRMSEVIRATFPLVDRTPVSVLSGPSFADEVARALPTALTIACPDISIAERLQQDFSSRSMRIYTNDDVIGVELGGALKNVIAIATGIASGLELGHNAAAALITRGVAEVTRLAVACGGRRETLSGLSGLGDLVLTCNGSLSRNRAVGIALGRGETLGEILASLGGKVAEGVRTTSAAIGLARKYGVEMPITEQMDAILNQGIHPRAAIEALMARPGREE